MKLSASLQRRLHWFNLPTAVLITLLQRTPVVRIATAVEEMVASSPIGAVLKSVATAVASLGAMNSLAGATPLVPSSGTSSGITVTTGTPVSVAYTVNGTQTPPMSWSVAGTIPAGLNFSGLTGSGGTVDVSQLLLGGTPTTVGTYPLTITCWEGAGGTQISANGSLVYGYTITVVAGGATAPAFTTQPTSQSVTAGANVTFTVAVSGSPTPTLQWKKGGVDIPTATGTSLTLNNVQAADAATYTVVATNSAGTATSNGAVLTVSAATSAPAFTTQPTSQSVTTGANVTFTVAVSGSPTPTIQWKKGGTDIAGATSLTLSLNNVQASDAATYTAVATNSAGTATSNGAVLTVSAAASAPAFTTQPTSQSVTTGANVTFTVAVSGNPTPTIQWKKGGTDIAGATSLTLTLNNVQASDAATYTAVATNASGTATSNGAVLTVSAAASAPAFTTQPSSQTVTAGGTAVFTVAVTGNPTPTLQWKKGGTDIAGATSATLTLNNVQAADAANYTVVATNSAGSATSSVATLTVNPSLVPTVLTQPQGHTVATGHAVVFGADISGGGLTYQWKKNGTNIGGATSSQLLLNNTQASDSGSYTVTATNGSGSVTSAAAVLNVVTTSDPGRLINVSVRIVSGLGADTLFMGFVTGGSGTNGTKQLLIRGIGPTLADFGVPNVMVDPILDIIPQGAATPSQTNDDWAGNTSVVNTGNAVGAFALPLTTSKDSALLATLTSGVYSAKVSGKNNTTGTVLAEIYDANASTFNPTTPRLINISARAAMANDNPLIAGFVVGGSTAKTLLIRAIGPELLQYGVNGAMVDPLLEIIRSGSSTPSYSNDNWGGATLITSTGNSVGAFALTNAASKDAVLLVTLDPGVYSAKVTGVNNGSGITLVEVYEIP